MDIPKSKEELEQAIEQVEADLDDVQSALLALSIQPDKNNVRLLVRTSNYIGRVPVKLLRKALEVQQFKVEEALSILMSRRRDFS